MSKIIRATLAFTLALLIAGCAGLPSSITNNLDVALSSLEVDIVQCFDASEAAVDTLAVGESAICDAWNTAGTKLIAGGVSTVIWESEDPAVVEVNIEGGATAKAVGLTHVIGRGANGSSGSWQIEVR